MAERHDIIFHPYAQTLIRIKARQLCRRADFNRSDLEDLHQEMRLYLLKVGPHFDPQRSSIQTFIARALDSCVATILRNRRRDKRCINHQSISLEGTELSCDEEKVSLGSVITPEDQSRRTGNVSRDPIEEVDMRDALEFVNRQLSQEQQTLASQVIQHRKAGAARLRRTSRSQIAKALQGMRRHIEAAGFGAD